MPRHRIRARPPHGVVRLPEIRRDVDALAGVVDDAAHYPGGHAAGVAAPATEGEVAALVRHGAVLPIGAQSSLTGGATPFGEIVLSTSKFNAIVEVGGGVTRVGAGLTLTHLQQALRDRGLYYPPGPTYSEACCGGIVATNAAGPATFKYGTTRDWVAGLTVVLATGDVLDLRRGDVVAHPDGYFEIETREGSIRVPVPDVSRPDVPKCSAGYYGAPGMDLVDLFVGSEGTLGVATEVSLRVIALPAAECLAVVPVETEVLAILLTGALRRTSIETRVANDVRGIDVASIEHMDRRAIDLLEADGHLRREHVTVPRGTGVLLIAALELPTELRHDDGWRQLESALDPHAPDTPLRRLCQLLDDAGVLDAAEIVLPDDERRRAQIVAVREAVPHAVNQRIAAARAADPAITKTAGDMIVPFERFDQMMAACRHAFVSRGLDLVVWGHISDGNVHPNAIPRSREDVGQGVEAILELGAEVIRLGGSPLAEHGVGRNPTKKRLMAMMYGEAGVRALEAVKRALDPDGRLAPGVLV